MHVIVIASGVIGIDVVIMIGIGMVFITTVDRRNIVRDSKSMNECEHVETTQSVCQLTNDE